LKVHQNVIATDREGSHEALVAQGGLYSELFALQAEGDKHFVLEKHVTAVNRVKFIIPGIVLLHLGISTIHGLAHQGAMVALNTFGYVYVLVVITVAPLVAAGLLFSRWAKMGALLLALSMLGSFVFGVWYHFLSATSDNVVAVHGPWSFMFLWTAIALAIIELTGALLGIVAFRTMRSVS